MKPEALIEEGVAAGGPIVFLTGAGISQESGIPTFRGPEGYWRAGSVNYHPMELATFAAFSRDPAIVWAWYLHRRGKCHVAAPNVGHMAIAEVGRRLGARSVLITQNVDGLHLRAGSPPKSTYEIHGNIDFMRCAAACGPGISALPPELDLDWSAGRALTPAEQAWLSCEACGGPMRPHVLWFDETYDEEHFRFESSLRVAGEAGLLVVVGTTGQTNLPLHVGNIVALRQVPMIVVDPEPSPFTQMTDRSPRGAYVPGRAGEHVPRLCQAILEHFP
jgi:NAD-dependent deacetylase